jgi:hypothetical protein
MPSMDMSETTTNEEPLIHEFTAIYGSYYILGDRLYLYIIALLSAAWLSAQLRRYLVRDLNAGCWYVWDTFGLASVALLGQKQKWALACVFTSFYFVWTRLPGSPLDNFRLPSFGTFLETSTKRSTIDSKIAGTADSEPECIVCWSSDEMPALLPCYHLICRDCLTAMKDRQQTHCPMCRHELFHTNDAIQIAIHKAAAAALSGRLTVKGLHLILQLWHGLYCDTFTSGITYLPELYCFNTLHMATLTQGTNWWRLGIFTYLLPIPLPETRFGRSAWPAAIFALLFAVGVLATLENIEELDLVLDKVVHRKPLPEF